MSFNWYEGYCEVKRRRDKLCEALNMQRHPALPGPQLDVEYNKAMSTPDNIVFSLQPTRNSLREGEAEPFGPILAAAIRLKSAEIIEAAKELLHDEVRRAARNAVNDAKEILALVVEKEGGK